MRIAFFGDLVGRAGRDGIVRHLPGLIDRLGLEFVVVNGENAAGGFGITADICETLFDAGVDVITLGNHAWDQRDIMVHIEREPRLIRPINFPEATPGNGEGLFLAKNGAMVHVINAMGRVFMDPLDDPFEAVEAAVEKLPLGRDAAARIVDFHGEASSEKMAMGHFCDGRASLVVGTHCHVPTADAQIFPGGTAYQSDAGMCGDYDSVIGMQKEEPVRRFRTKLPGGRNTPALGEATVCGCYLETDDVTGLATRFEPIRVGGRLAEALPHRTREPLEA